MSSIEIINTTSELGEAILLEPRFDPFFWSFMGFNIICIAFIQTVNPRYLKLLFETAIYNRHLIPNTRDDLNLRRLPSILLNFTYFTSFSACLYTFTPTLPSSTMFVYLGGFILLFLIKYLSISTIAFIRQSKSGTTEHILNHFIFFQAAGIILTPVLIFTHYLSNTYAKPVSIGLLSIIILFILVRELQSLVRAFQSKVSVFYIILYLCTLELLPLIVGIRVITLNIEVLN